MKANDIMLFFILVNCFLLY